MDDRPDRWGVRTVRGWLSGAMLALAVVACDDREVPGALVGHWGSSDPRYEGRALVISPATIAFASGPLASESFVIERVESESAHGGDMLHTVHYRDVDGSTRTLRLRVLAGSTPRLRFENHDELWVRESGDPEPPRGG